MEHLRFNTRRGFLVNLTTGKVEIDPAYKPPTTEEIYKHHPRKDQVLQFAQRHLSEGGEWGAVQEYAEKLRKENPSDYPQESIWAKREREYAEKHQALLRERIRYLKERYNLERDIEKLLARRPYNPNGVRNERGLLRQPLYRKCDYGKYIRGETDEVPARLGRMQLINEARLWLQYDLQANWEIED